MTPAEAGAETGKNTATDTLDPALARRWLATFGRQAPPDGIMPQGIHFCLCTPEARTDALGKDGHPPRGDSLASVLPRRMWAGSEIAFQAPIAVGATVERVSRVVDMTEKDGRSGRLAFVTIHHETSADGVLAVTEEQSLVYRAAAAPDAPLAPPEIGEPLFDERAWDRVRTIAPSEVLLQRYSALTFNSHRIHYDLPYAQRTERYRGLVVHGPLIATLLLDLVARHCGDNGLASFSFRGVSPAITGEALHLCLRTGEGGLELGAFAADGRQVTKADATLADNR